MNKESIYINGKPVTFMLPDFGFTPNTVEDSRKKIGSPIPKNSRSYNESANGDFTIDETDIREFDVLRGKITPEGKRVKFAPESDIKVVIHDEDTGKLKWTEVIPVALIKDTGVPKKEDFAKYQLYEHSFTGWGYERVYDFYVHTQEFATITNNTLTLDHQLTDKSDIMVIRVGDKNLSEELYTVTPGADGGESTITISSLISTAGKKAKVVFITTLTEVPVE